MADEKQTRRGPRFSRRGAGDALPSRAAARARNGDDEALLFLYACYADRVHAESEAILRDLDHAEALTQLVFIELPSSLQQYDPGVEAFETWLVGLARRAALARAHVSD